MNKENELTEFMAKAIMDSGKTYNVRSIPSVSAILGGTAGI